MQIEIQKYARNPFYVDAVRVTEDNMAAVAIWCNGDVRAEKKPGGGKRTYIKVKVLRPLNPEQTKAYVGDWVLFAGSGYKKYTDHAFSKSFYKVEDPNEVPSLGYTVNTSDEPPRAGGLSEVDPLVPFSKAQNDALQEESDLATEHLDEPLPFSN